MAERLDLAAVLGENALVVQLRKDGPEYHITDVPVRAALQAAAEGEDGELKYLTTVLEPACADEAARESLHADLEALGQRGRHVLSLKITDFVGAEDLLPKLGLSPRLLAVLEGQRAG